MYSVISVFCFFCSFCIMFFLSVFFVHSVFFVGPKSLRQRSRRQVGRAARRRCKLGLCSGNVSCVMAVVVVVGRDWSGLVWSGVG